MITGPLINWQPIATMPEDWKDGRDVLLWDKRGAVVGTYDLEKWWMSRDTRTLEPSHWADINPPE